MSGFCRPAAAKMSTTPSEAMARETICRTARSSSSCRLRLARRPLQQAGAHRLHEGDIVANAQRLVVRDGQRKRLRQLLHGVQQAVLAVLLRQDVFLRRRQQPHALGRCAGHPCRALEAVEEPAADFVFLQHHGDRLVLIERRAPRAAALGVGGERLLELVRQPQVVHHQPTRLVAEDAVHPRDRLHEAVPAHRLVDVHRVQARRVEARQPHVAHEHDLEWVLGVAEAVGERLAARLVADVRLPVERVGGRARHHHLDHAPVVIRVVPVRPQRHDLAVELDADAPAHADDHGLAVHRLQPLVQNARRCPRRSASGASPSRRWPQAAPTCS